MGDVVRPQHAGRSDDDDDESTAGLGSFHMLDMSMVATLTDAELFGEPELEPLADRVRKRRLDSGGTADATSAVPRTETATTASDGVSVPADTAREAREEPTSATTAAGGDMANATTTPAPLGATSDERFMRHVLTRLPFETTAATARMKAWENVARTFLVPSCNGSVASRVDVTKRVAFLTLELLERPQNLTPKLRTMVLEFNVRNCKAGFAARLDPSLLQRLRENAERSEVVESAVASPRPDVIVSTQPRAATSRDTTMVLDNEQLLRFVIQFRPFEVSQRNEKAVWQAIVDAYTAAHPGRRLTSVIVARRRVHQATTVFVNRVDPYYTHFSHELRTMLVEFNQQRHTSTTQRPQGVPSPEIVRVRTENNELFLRIVMDKRPFEAENGGKRHVWDDVAYAFVASGGGSMRNGQSAVRYMGKLTRAMLEHPRSLPPAVRALILEYHELNSRWQPGDGKRRELLKVIRKHAMEADEVQGPLSSGSPESDPNERGASHEDSTQKPPCATTAAEASSLSQAGIGARVEVSTCSSIASDKDVRSFGDPSTTPSGNCSGPTVSLQDEESVPTAICTEDLARDGMDDSMASGDEDKCLETNTEQVDKGAAAESDEPLQTSPHQCNLRRQNSPPPIVRVSPAVSEDEAVLTRERVVQNETEYASDDTNKVVVSCTSPASSPRDNEAAIAVSLGTGVPCADRGEAEANDTNEDECLLDPVIPAKNPSSPTMQDVSNVQSMSSETSFQHEQGSSEQDDMTTTTASLAVQASSVLRKEPSQSRRVTQFDERLMQLVLDTRPFLVSEPPTVFWPAVTSRLRQVKKELPGGEAICAEAVRARVKWLRDVFLDIDHDEHACLSPSLRSLLSAYTKVSSERLEHLLACLYECSPTLKAGRVRMVRESLDDVLLREVLRTRFKQGESSAAWRRVAEAVNVRVGTIVFTRAKTCKRRTKTLLDMYRGPAQVTLMKESVRDKLCQLEVALRPTRSDADDNRGHVLYCATKASRVRDNVEFQPEPETASEVPSRLSADSHRRLADHAADGLLPLCDERLMRLVLDASPCSQPFGKRMSAWSKVAQLWADEADVKTSMTFSNGASVKMRVQFLVVVCGDRSHREHHKATEELKTLVLKYSALQGTHRPTTVSNRKRKQPIEDLESSSRSSGPVISEQQSPMTPRWGETCPQSANLSPTSGKTSRRVVRERDEGIVRLLLSARPFWAHTKCATPMWDFIAESTTSPQIQSGSDAKQVVEWLVEIAQDPNHPQQHRLGPNLLGLLKEYWSPSTTELQSAFKRARHYVERYTKLSLKKMTFDDVMIQEALGMVPDPYDPWRSVSERLNTRFKATVFSSDACEDRIRALLYVYECNEDHPYISLTDQQKSLLRQFKASNWTRKPLAGPSTASAEPVSLSSTKKSKRKAHDTESTARCTSPTENQRDCGSQLKRRRVQNDVDATNHDEHDAPHDEEAAKAEIVFEVAVNRLPLPAERSLKCAALDAIAWEVNKQLGYPSFKKGPHVLAYIHQVLERIQTDPNAFPTAVRELAVLYTAIHSTPKRHERARPVMVAPNDSRVSPPPSSSPLPKPARLSASRLLVEPSQARVEGSADATSHAAQVVGGSLDPAIHASILEPTPSNSNQTATANKDSVRPLTDQLVQQLDAERRDHHAQHQSLVELLKAEREAQRRETQADREAQRREMQAEREAQRRATQALLDAMERERQSRRDEFVAMTRLLARPQAPTRTAPASPVADD